MTNRMTTALAAAATVLAAGAFAAPAQAGHGWGWGPAAGGFVAGTMIGAAAASSAYAQPAYRCKVIEHYDQWGNYLGSEKVCRTW